MTFRPAVLVATLLALASVGAARAEEPDLIFKKSTVWKLLTPDHKLAVYGIDDPDVEGVACHYTVPEKGGLEGMFAVAVMAMSAAWYLQMLNDGWSNAAALGLTVLGVVFIGFVNGFLIAYADVPAIFATLASGSFVFGYVRSQLITQDAVPVPRGNWLESLGSARLLDIPAEVFVFAGASFAAYLFLRYTKWGRFVYYMGDNLMAARNIGIPVRPMTLLRYVMSSLIALAAGLLTASTLLSINTRVVNSSLLYDVILVVVIGGIGLSGGKGGMRNVIGGAILIGIMFNAMTIMDIPNIYQNLIKATILLIAIIVDSLLNPRDEQTAQQGDI